MLIYLASTAICKCETNIQFAEGKKSKGLIYCTLICQSVELWGTVTKVLVNSTGLMNRYNFPNFYCCTPPLSDYQANAKGQVPFEWHMASVNQRDVTTLNKTSRKNKNTKCQISSRRTRYASTHLSPLEVVLCSWVRCEPTFPTPRSHASQHSADRLVQWESLPGLWIRSCSSALHS